MWPLPEGWDDEQLNAALFGGEPARTDRQECQGSTFPEKLTGMANKKLGWGVLGVADIAISKVIPAMRKCVHGEIVAIASRDLGKAARVAKDLGIRSAYGSYEDLLADPNVDVVYNPLPNHLHVPWSVRALEAGKHVLCEKPIATSLDQCKQLIEARNLSGRRVGEAFMIKTHPQWARAMDLVRFGEIGELRAVIATFGYSNRDPGNIRNVVEYGGGALWDIGCYLILVSRMLFAEEPTSVSAIIDKDPWLEIDRLTSALLSFPSGHCTLTCSTQVATHQKVHILGSDGNIDVEVPFNAPSDRKCRISIKRGHDLFDGYRAEEFDVCDQYTMQADLFSLAVLETGDVPTPLEDSMRNIAVIEAIFESARTSRTIHLTSHGR